MSDFRPAVQSLIGEALFVAYLAMQILSSHRLQFFAVILAKLGATEGCGALAVIAPIDGVKLRVNSTYRFV